MKCPKCQYVRQPGDEAPEWQCPACGIAYAKFADGNGDERPSVSRSRPSAKPQHRGISFRKLRITLLLMVLVGVALDSWLTVQRSTDWNDSLWVVVYPIAAESSPEVSDYIKGLNNERFSEIERYIGEQAQHYGIQVKNPFEVRLGPVVGELPPLPPHKGSIFDIMVWSLKLRYWSLVMDEYDGPRPDIRVFVLYHEWREKRRLDHSTGLQKGMVSVVHAFAKEKLDETNNVVIAHEILHTLGATDKYDLTTGQPRFPDGLAEPQLEPRYPQSKAELMGAYIAVEPNKSVMPRDLGETVIGPATAREIGWLKEE